MGGMHSRGRHIGEQGEFEKCNGIGRRI